MAAIELTLYGKDDEAKKKYTKRTVSWGFLKRAIRLSEQLDEGKQAESAEPGTWLERFQKWLHRNDRKLSSEEQMIDIISEFVVDVFDGQFTVKELEDGAEIGEIMTVLQSIISRARLMVPTNPPPKTARKRH